jgi:hypothetical protein
VPCHTHNTEGDMVATPAASLHLMRECPIAVPPRRAYPRQHGQLVNKLSDRWV